MLQGDEVDVEETMMGNLDNESQGPQVSETTQFVDMNSGGSVGAASAYDVVAKNDAMDSVGLAGFLSRPVRILQLAWSTSDSTGRLFGTYSPWQLFFNNQYIKYKLNNYAFIRCNLKLKVIINASPFYYGAVRMAYSPMTVWRGNTDDVGSTAQILMRASQKPGVWLDPSMSEGAEFTCPFFYHRNYLDVGTSAAFSDIGDIRFYCYAPLTSANGVASSSVSIQVYAWAEDVQLVGPTLGLALQGDEYGTGIISGPATAVANVARAAKNLPVIGKFAAATEIGASATSKIAKLFGFTNTPVLDDAKPFRPSPFPQMASTEIGYPVEKLTVDSKNELSVDPTITGLSNEDELALSYLVGKESVLSVAPWLTTDAPDTNICTVRVNPYQFITSLSAPAKIFTCTPTCMVAHLFKHWRGDLIFKFKFVATPFHKGRVRISYDPLNSNMQTATDIGSILRNTIVDLGVSREVEVRVPFQQAISWLEINKDLTIAPFGVGNSGLTVQPNYDNGIITMKVLTTLSAPVSTAPVSVITTIRGAENLEFANPDDLNNLFTPFPLQGAEVDVAPVTLGVTQAQSDDLYRVNFGEKVASLRPLLRRSQWLDTMRLLNADGTAVNIYSFTSPRKAAFVGYDSAAYTQAKGFVATTTNLGFNWTKLSAWHWISPAFAAQRGAFHWHYNLTGSRPVQNASVTRLTSGTNARAVYKTSIVHADIAQAFQVSNMVGTNAGVAITNGQNQSGISVSLPNHSPYKFQTTNPIKVNSPNSGTLDADGSQNEFVRLDIVTGSNSSDLTPVVQRYFSVGTDYNLHFFVCTPIWYIMPIWPAYPS